VRRHLLALACVLATVAAALAATGGAQISFANIRLSARSPRAALLGAIAAAAAWLVLSTRARGTTADSQALDRWMGAYADRLALLVAVVAAASAVAFQTFSATGSDASGYLSLAALMSEGRLKWHEPLAAIADWPDAALTVAPLGWRLSAEPFVQVPSYPAGVPLLMAPLHAVGGALAASMLGPVALALLVWASARVATVLGGAHAGLLAAVGVATSPAALIAAAQPMSDLPAAAAWLSCWAYLVPRPSDIDSGSSDLDSGSTRVRAAAAGCAAAVAVMIRPNLAPLGLVPLAYVLIRGGGQRRTRTTLALWFAGPVAVSGFIVAVAHTYWYGSPLRSGYGTADDLYDVRNFLTNVRLYTAWLLETHGPWLLVAPAAVFLAGRRLAIWLLAFAAANALAYFVFAVFEVWTYLRFLLAAIAIASICVGAMVAAGLKRLPPLLRSVAFLVMVLVVAVGQIQSARSRDVFALRDHHARAQLAGHYLEARLLDRSLIVAGEQSGALRYYTNHSILRWDLCTLESFMMAIRRAADAGYDVWIALDEWEENAFRAKFAGTGIGDLDWPPEVDAGITLRTRAWRVRDRESYVRGAAAHTVRLR
jgi:hypothetical protein